MTDPRCDAVLTPESLEGSEATVETNSGGSLCSEHGETSDPLPGSMEEFIRDRFSTKLEDPHTGRRIR